MKPVMERFTDLDGFFRIFLFQKEANQAKLSLAAVGSPLKPGM